MLFVGALQFGDSLNFSTHTLMVSLPREQDDITGGVLE